MNKRFNIRVYGILVQNNKLLVNEEKIRSFNTKVVKLPGGGLEWGEGTIECLKREWKEEMNIDITVNSHFYTTDFFQASAFDESQVISIYYLVSGNVPDVIVNNVPGERTYWLDRNTITADSFTLPIDKIVGQMLADGAA